jgi:DNA repair exonuclease SbcCD ATPase subunit
MLKDLLTSIENEEKDEAANFKCFVQWCDTTIEAKKGEIDEASMTLENNKVAVQQHSAKIATTTYQVDKSKEEVTETQDALAQAEAMRNEENTKYAKERAMNMQSQGQIGTALKIVNKVHQVGGFIQGGVVQQTQLNAPGESSFVVGVFESLEANLKRNQEKADADEEKRVKSYNDLSTNKQAQLTALNEQIQKKNIALTESKQKKTQALNDIETITGALQEDKIYLDETTASCEDKKKEWQIRSEDRAKEKSAIREAISFLVITFKEKESEEAKLLLLQRQQQARDDSNLEGDLSFVQTSMSTDSLGGASAMLDTADAELSALTSRVNSAAKADIFENVKKTINDLVGVLQVEQQEETEKNKWCKAELAKKDTEKKDVSDKIGNLEATIDSQSNEVSMLVKEVTEIKAMMEESKKADETAATLRKDQKKIYDVGTKDRKLAIKVLKEAKSVLGKFYESQDKTFLQVGQGKQAPPKTWDKGSRKTGEGNVVLAMLDKIVSDVVLEQKEAEKDENEQATAFEEHMRNSRKEYDDRMEEITARVTRRAKLEVQVNNNKETRDQQKDKLSAVNGQLEGLHADCDELIKNFEERTKARTFETNQLKDVIDILAGSQVAARTGFLQQQQDNINDKELGQLQSMSRTIDDLELKARHMVN